MSSSIRTPTARAVVAGRPGGDHYADRVVLSPNAVVVLDGAPASEPAPAAGVYAQLVGCRIAAELHRCPDLPLADAVATAIDHAATSLALRPGTGPSSTVSVLRVRSAAADLYVLGDSPIHYGTAGTSEVLVGGHGARLASTDPGTARDGLTITLGRDAIGWAVLATGGAARHLDRIGHSWEAVSRCDQEQLVALLDEAHARETDARAAGADPAPTRAERHRDTTLVALPTVW